MSLSKTGDNEYTFAFTEKNTFDGKAFFDRYIGADFLTEQKNLTKILSQGHELRKCFNISGADQITIEGMFLEPGHPLVIKKSNKEDESDVGDQEFTLRRLSGLAAFVASKQPFLARITEAEELGLGWGEEEVSHKLYLAAVSGAELFMYYFDVLPFICALRKFQLKKMSAEKLFDMARIPCVNGEPAGKRLRTKYLPEQSLVTELEEKFFGGSKFKIEAELMSVPRPFITYIMAL